MSTRDGRISNPSYGGLRWEFSPVWRELTDPRLLFGAGGLRLDEWLASGQARIIKHAPHRTVYRVTLPGQDFHVKHYRGDGREWLRSLVRKSKARAEYEITRETARRGVPTLEALAFGETSGLFAPADSFLITRTLPDAVPLVDYFEEGLPALPEPRRTRTRQELSRALGDFLARKHRAGLRHDDLHPGNLLIRFGTDARIELYLIDLHAVHQGGPLSWPASQANLVILNRWFAIRCNRADRRRAWSAYCQAREDLALDERSLVRAVERATHTSFVAFAWDLDRRCLGGNRHYRRVRTPGIRGWTVADLDEAALAPLLAHLDQLFSHPDARVLKQSASSAVVEMDLLVAGALRQVIFKRFSVKGRSGALASLIRPGSGLRSWVLGHGLRFRGLPTPRPLALWHRTRWGMVREAYLLMEKVPEAVPLARFVRDLAGLPPGEGRSRLRLLIEETASVVRMLHERNLSHRDLKAANLLVSPAGWTMGYRGLREAKADQIARRDRVWLIDLVGVRRHGKLGRRRMVQNLARLNVSFVATGSLSRTDRLRFLRGWLVWGLRGREGWKSWWKEVEAASRAKIERNLRSGRVLG
jgi:serine/threonine protein kinase